MSQTVVVSPIVAALLRAEEVLGSERRWQYINDTQRTFLTEYFAKRADLAKLTDKEMRSWVSRVAADLNAILKKEGFDIQLRDFGRDGFGVVAIMDVLVEWLVKGESTTLRTAEGKTLSAVSLPSTVALENDRLQSVFHVLVPRGGGAKIVEVHTKSNEVVYMTEAGPAEAALEGLALLSRIGDFFAPTALVPDYATDYADLTFPKVDLNSQVDISWLLGMKTVDNKGVPAIISQALQQTKFKMNEVGARAKSAVAIAISRGAALKPKESLVIRPPFMLWINRAGMRMPVFAGIITEEDCKNQDEILEFGV